MPRLAAPPNFQPKSSSPLVAAKSALTAAADQRVAIPNIGRRYDWKKGHVLPAVAPSRHAFRQASLRKPRNQVRSLSECDPEKSAKPETLARRQSRAPLPPTPYLRWNYITNKRTRTMWAHRWEARHDITYKSMPWESRSYSIPKSENPWLLDSEIKMATSLILYGTPPESEFKIRLKRDKESGRGRSSIWKAEVPWDDDLRNNRYLRKLRREQAAILEQVNANLSAGKTNTVRNRETSAKGEGQGKRH